MSTPVLTITDVQKNYGALRPLRVKSLEVAARERVALSGVDALGAEVLVNLVTGATLPDEGTVTTFGRATADVSDADVWLASIDKFGLVTSRAVLLEASTLLQNLALPFTLSIDEIPADVAARAAKLARECGIPQAELERPASDLSAPIRARVHLARAIALDPELLIVEHPTADVAEHERVPLARDFAAVIDGRALAALILTQDEDFAEVVAHRSLAVEPATGAVVPWKKKRGWFR